MSQFCVKLRRNENGFGFSLLKSAEFSHVIYDIIENSSASSEEVEAGDVIVKVNGMDVHRLSTKEVLKCLRLSSDPVELELKRDPKIKNHVKSYLASSNSPSSFHRENDTKSLSPTSSENSDNSSGGGHAKGHKISSSDSLARKSKIPVNSSRASSWSAPQSPQAQKVRHTSQIPTPNGSKISNFNQPHQEKEQQQTKMQPNKARFEAYMMTGDLILNLSRTPQNSDLLPATTKKVTVDSLRDSPNRQIARRKNNCAAPHAKYDSSSPSPTSPNLSEHNSNSSSSQDSNSMAGLIKKSQLCEKVENTSNVNLSTNYQIKKNKLMSDNNRRETEMGGDGPNSAENMGQDQNDFNSGCAEVESSMGTPNCYRKDNSSLYNKDGTSNKVDENDEYDSRNKTYDVRGRQNSKKNKKYTAQMDDEIEGNPENYDEQNYSRFEYQKYEHYSLLTETVTVAPLPSNSPVTPSSTSTSSASTTINRSETLHTPTPEMSYSMPTSPTSLSTPLIENTTKTMLLSSKQKELAISLPTSPESGQQEFIKRSQSNQQHQQQQNGVVVRKCDSVGFRTSRSEDHLQNSQREGLGAIVPIDIDEDVNSSLNTLLDTRRDSEDSQSSDHDRIVWTYNAPVPTSAGAMGTITSPISNSSSISISPQHSCSPASPTSMSSSVMSSSGSKGNGVGNNATNNGYNNHNNNNNLMYQMNGDHSISEAISNISSPDYQDEHDLLSAKDLISMAISDPSDSDSTLLVSETTHQVHEKSNNSNKLVIQVSPENRSNKYSHESIREQDDELHYSIEDTMRGMELDSGKDSSPPVSDDGSDVDSLHSFHYSPKAVDVPSAIRLAKRLYFLDGFKKSDVSRHLSKNNDFSRAVADEYLKFFLFEKLSLDESLRLFLKQFALSGETQERERVLVHFSKRYLDCNPGTFNSQDAVHTLTCAIMLLNTDLHGQNIGRKMNCSEFIENLSELNDGENFPRDTLKLLYNAIKQQPLEWALDDDTLDPGKNRSESGSNMHGPQVGSNPFLDLPQNVASVEYKKGYVMRKCCYESNNKKTPFGKRSWKMFYCTLRDMVLYLHKDERGFHKNQVSDNIHNSIRIHHSLASKATDYVKKQHVFRLQTADQSEYLFQTSDSKELQSWIDTINFVAASFSAPPLEGGVGSQKRFQRPLLPCSQTKLLLREQLASHEQQVEKLENVLQEHRSTLVPTKGLAMQNHKEKETYLQYELKRYKTYVYLLNSHMSSSQPNDLINVIISSNAIGESLSSDVEDSSESSNGAKTKQQNKDCTNSGAGAQTQQQQQHTTQNRYSYRTAIYRSDEQEEFG